MKSASDPLELAAHLKRLEKGWYDLGYKSGRDKETYAPPTGVSGRLELIDAYNRGYKDGCEDSKQHQ